VECLRLRVKDIDFEQSQVVVREDKGEKDRLTMLPVSLAEPLKAQIAFVKQQHFQKRSIIFPCGDQGNLRKARTYAWQEHVQGDNPCYNNPMTIIPIRSKRRGTLTGRERFNHQMHCQLVDRCFNMGFGC
jgi:integrase